MSLKEEIEHIFREEKMGVQSNIINFEKIKLKMYLEKNGFQWHEDTSGKVRIWIKKIKNSPENSGGSFFEGKNKH